MKFSSAFPVIALASVVVAIPQTSADSDLVATVLKENPDEPQEMDASIIRRDVTPDIDDTPTVSEFETPINPNYAGDHRFDARKITSHPHAVIIVDDDGVLPNDGTIERRDDAKTLGVYGCCNPSWKGECTWTPMKPGFCQTFDCVQGPDLGSSFGPDKGITCDLFVGPGCAGPRITNWAWGHPQSVDTGSQFWVKAGFKKGIVSYMCWPA